MLKVGLTGGVGSGKSTVAAMLAAHGAKYLDSDAVVHRLMRVGSTTWKQLTKEFGKEILLKSKKINRRKLANIVFNQPRKLRKLEHLIHPSVKKEIRTWLKDCQKNKRVKVAVVEVPLLFEAHLEKMFDRVVAVTAPKSLQVARGSKLGIANRQEVMSRIRSQMSQTKKAKKADFVIRNNGSKKELKIKVNKLWEKCSQ